MNNEEKPIMDISQIFNDYYQYIYNYALKLTCHPDDAMDLTQETFLKAWKKLEQLTHQEALASWLRTICFHIFLSNMRKKQGIQEQLEEDFVALEEDGKILQQVTVLPEDEVVVAEEISKLQNGCFLAMVRKLSLNQRIAFSLVDMYGLDIEYVADILDLSKGATKGLLYRARMNIDSFFADHCDLLNEKNPCSCKAWIQFSTNRANMQTQAKKIVNHLDYKENKYTYREDVRKKITYLYANMPEWKPSKEWYDKVLDILKTQKNN